MSGDGLAAVSGLARRRRVATRYSFPTDETGDSYATLAALDDGTAA